MEALEFSFKIDKLIVSVSLGICCQGNSQHSPTTESPPPNWMYEVAKWQRGLPTPWPGGGGTQGSSSSPGHVPRKGRIDLSNLSSKPHSNGNPFLFSDKSCRERNFKTAHLFQGPLINFRGVRCFWKTPGLILPFF